MIPATQLEIYDWSAVLSYCTTGTRYILNSDGNLPTHYHLLQIPTDIPVDVSVGY